MVVYYRSLKHKSKLRTDFYIISVGSANVDTLFIDFFKNRFLKGEGDL